MLKPEYVSHSKFPVEKVLFNDGGFFIAWGEWNEERQCIGMRWDDEGDDPGYPKLFSNPVWFVLPEELSITILISLIGKKGANNIQSLIFCLRTCNKGKRNASRL